MGVEVSVIILDLRSSLRPRRYRFDQNDITIGRAVSNSLCIPAPEIDLIQCRVRVERSQRVGTLDRERESKVFITALGSSSPTLVDNIPIPLHIERRLKATERVFVGGSLLRIVAIPDSVIAPTQVVYGESKGRMPLAQGLRRIVEQTPNTQSAPVRGAEVADPPEKFLAIVGSPDRGSNDADGHDVSFKTQGSTTVSQTRRHMFFKRFGAESRETSPTRQLRGRSKIIPPGGGSVGPAQVQSQVSSVNGVDMEGNGALNADEVLAVEHHEADNALLGQEGAEPLSRDATPVPENQDVPDSSNESDSEPSSEPAVRMALQQPVTGRTDVADISTINFEAVKLCSVKIVITHHGAPLSAVEVDARQLGRRVTHPNGVCALENIDEGSDIRLTFSRPKFVFDPPSVSLTSSDRHTVSVTASELFSLSGSILHRGVGLPEVSVRVSGVGETVTDANGEFRFNEVVEATRYHVELHREHYRFECSAPTGIISEDTSVRFEATKLVTVSGIVTYQGRPVEGVVVDGGGLGIARTDSEGRYAFFDIPEGTDYTITPTKEGYRFQPYHGIS